MKERLVAALALSAALRELVADVDLDEQGNARHDWQQPIVLAFARARREVAEAAAEWLKS